MSSRMAISCSSNSMSRSEEQKALAGPGGIEQGFPPAGAVSPAHSACLLVLGSFPSLQSQAKGQYYGHERNCFWRLVCRYAGMEEPPSAYEARMCIAGALGIIIWDMIAVCRRRTSADDSLEILSLNNIEALLAQHPSIFRIGLNGSLAARLFLSAVARKPASFLPQAGSRAFLELAGSIREVVRLPSTSPVPSSRFRTCEDRASLWFGFFSGRQASRTC